MLLATIGDHTAKISDVTKSKYHHLPWKKIKDVRNRIVHDYVGVDYDIVFEILTNEIPDLILSFQKLIREEVNNGVFSTEELRVAVSSKWYRHVSFTSFE